MKAVVLRIGLLAALIAGCAGEHASGPSASDCEQARDREIALRLPDDMPEKHREQHAGALERSLGDRYLERCQNEWSPERVECLLSANSASAARGCAGN